MTTRDPEEAETSITPAGGFQAGPFYFESSGRPFPFAREVLVAGAERAYGRIRASLQEPDDLRSMKIRFADQVGRATPDGVIMPYTYDADARLDRERYYEIYLEHEMVHHLVQVHWRWNPGPPSFLNEGLAQWIAEGGALAATRGFTYGDYVRELLLEQRYIPLREIIPSHRFLGMCHDHRVAAEAAAFVGFLLSVQEWGVQRFRAAFARARRDHDRSTTTCNVLQVFREVYGQPLELLEARWHLDVLRGKRSAPAARSIARCGFAPDSLPRVEDRCVKCGSRIEPSGSCRSCGAGPDHQLCLLE